MDPTLASVAASFGACGLLLIAAANGWSARVRATVVRMYTDPFWPYLIRIAGPTGNALGPVAIAFGALAILPPSLARWAAAFVLLAFPVALSLCYRAPLWLLSPWFRAELACGRLPAPAPDPGQRSLLLLISIPVLLGGIAGLLLDIGV